ncbi:helix-turn-helix domain-containing protein [Sediminibacterium goheungense]|uniref:AraC family transcriptional regulator n=1 Tax=Sediminibacterium goheungense TaxID=1086393 RepID=A0A4R6IS95_9BACT|nr:helix-turn-helix domain-containing protein [Sediminibacterium goheungense]TDO25344.1 AraC family transcriptional regulator [Sediminibacterium goheungense]
MVLHEYKPGNLIAAYIRTFRLVHYNCKADGALPAKAYPPRPEHCLSFYARDPETVTYQNSGLTTGKLSSVLFGQQTEVSLRYVGNQFLLIQAVFKPGGLFRLTGIPSQLLTNQYIDASTIFSKEIKDVNEKINTAESFQQMIQVVESFLVREAKRKSGDIHPLDIATSQLFQQDTVPGVDALAKSSFQSVRHFERQFKLRMGVSPKYYLKVMRFENAFRMKNKNPFLDWLSIAINCGYYDYQHLVKDYKDLTGLSPTQFHEIDMQAPERVFGEADTY